MAKPRPLEVEVFHFHTIAFLMLQLVDGITMEHQRKLGSNSTIKQSMPRT